MAPPSACRLSMILSSVLLIFLLVATAGSTTVTKTHISTTKITVNNNGHHGFHAMASDHNDPDLVAEKSPPDLDLDLRLV